ncbi:MAG TPA: metal-sensitive transcriptional regulator [Candidatus Acidoferrales bacterium]|jgi:DNA-binding FrmR family transcriptional regulator|nr:metal-sensitive transcriptional regulator [Candidatus Acidoferrales bacterium]
MAGKAATKLKIETSCGCGTNETSRKALAVDPEIKSANLKRLRRIEGQVRGLQRLVGEDRYCADILIQISSVQEALRSVGRALMKNHLRHCASEAIRDAAPGRAESMYEELLNLMDMHSR